MTEALFVKICGITSEADALLSVSLGASAVGFIFAPSPRQVSVHLAGDIAKRLPEHVLTVGVFRDEAPQRIVDAVRVAGLGAAQLHGHETAEETKWVRARVPTVIKAFPAGDRTIVRFEDFGADYLLVDGENPGSGQVFDWRLAEGVTDPSRLIVSGGLRPDNVADAVAHLRPGGVDVASGVEAAPGRKDPLLLRDFIANARRAEAAVRGAGPTGRPRRRGALRLEGRVSDESAGLMGRPGADGRFGEFGGRFVPESLMPACLELEKWFDDAWGDPAFRAELDGLLRHYGGRPTPVTECVRLSERLGVRVLLKREDLAHTGSHKLNNVVGQALLTKRMGKSRMIAETGAGQHGVASATAAALFGLECTVFMGEVDTQRQELNVFRMELLGAEVRTVTSGSRTLKDAVNEAMREWVASVDTTHYCLGSVMGPHPFPYMVRQLQRVVGEEARQQCGDLLDGAAPDAVVACIGGGSNAAGTFAGFVDTPARLVGVEAAGGAAVTNGIPGVLHGMHSRLLQDEAGQIQEAESISAGLDYPGLGPEHAHLAAAGRAEYSVASDDEVLDAFRLLSHTEGIIPALESAHAVAWVARSAGTEALPAGSTVLVTLSGRGDKDVAQVREIFGRQRDA